MVLSEAVRDYLEYARHEAGHSSTTLTSYQSWQRRFLRWLEASGLLDPPIEAVTPNLVRRFSYSLSAAKLRPRTIRGALNALRALFGYLKEMGALPNNPVLEVAMPKKDAAIRQLVSDEELMRLLEAAERQGSDFRCVRDRAVLASLIFCGLRRQEVIDLTVESVNLSDSSVLVQQGKGRKARTVYLCEEALAAFREWLAIRQRFQCSHNALFITPDRRRFGETSLPRMLEEVKAIAGFKGDPRIKPHSIRHAAATRLLRNGADLRSIQTWLGHSHLQTTAIYLHTDEQQVRKIAPLASFQPDRPSSREEVKSPTKSNRVDFYRRRRESK